MLVYQRVPHRDTYNMYIYIYIHIRIYVIICNYIYILFNYIKIHEMRGYAAEHTKPWGLKL